MARRQRQNENVREPHGFNINMKWKDAFQTKRYAFHRQEVYFNQALYRISKDANQRTMFAIAPRSKLDHFSIIACDLRLYTLCGLY
jgi:hypothetical protein